MRGHLVRRGAIYWFRRRVPHGLVERLGRAELHRSLRTSCGRTAAARGHEAWLATEALFSAMIRNPKLAEAQARLLIDQLLQESVYDSPTAADLVEDICSGDSAIAHQLFSRRHVPLILELPPEDVHKVMAHAAMITSAVEARFAESRLKNERIRVATARRDADRLRDMLEANQQELAAARQAPAPAIAAPAPPPPPSPPLAAIVVEQDVHPEAVATKKGRRSSPRFSEVEPGYLIERSRAAGYSAQTLLQVKATFRLWVEIVGDRPVSDYTGKDAGSFRETLLRLPASHGKGGRQNAITAIKVADRKEMVDGIITPRLSMKTAKRHFSALSQVWVWLQPRDEVEKNIFRGFTFPGTKSSRRLRDDWSEEDLQKLFTSRWFADDVDEDAAQRWLPTISLYSGLRLEEACRLRPKLDMIQLDGIWTFMIQEQPEPEPWSPKSEAGERAVPVHPVLIELGLIDLVMRRRAEGAARLFPELRATGVGPKYSTETGRRFSKLKIDLGVGPKTTYHSFRHSVRTALGNTELKDSWIDAVMGHEGSDKGVGIAVYLKRIGIKNLKAVVDAIEYSDDVLMIVKAAMRPPAEAEAAPE